MLVEPEPADRNVNAIQGVAYCTYTNAKFSSS